jgi:sugar lactone lactonase YvrE
MRPTDVAFDASGRSLLIAEEVTGVVRRVSPVGSPSLVPILFPLIGDGVRQHGGDFGPAIEGSIHSPRHVTVSRDTDDVYITDVNTMVIRKVERDPASPVGAGAVGNSTITTFAGGITIISPTNSYTGSFGDGAPNATRVLMEKPGALAYSRTRNSVYIADTHLHTIRVLNLTSGVLSHFGGIATYNGAFAGDGLHVRSARFKTILGLSFNSAEDVLYVADSQNHIIRAINMTTNVIRTVVGRPTMQGFSGDGAIATSALLSIPAFASVSPDTGILYVVDNANNRLRAVDPRTGVITSISGGACSADEAVTNFTGTSTLHKNLRVVLAVPGGRVFFVDTGRSRVFLYNELTGFTTLFCGTMSSPSAMDWDPATSTLYVFATSRVFRCTSASTTPTTVAGTGSQGNAGDNGPALSATFRPAEGLAVVGNGTFVVAATEDRRLRLVTLFPSRVSALAGSGVVTIGEWCVGPDAPATCSRLVTETPYPTTAHPAEVAVGPGGDVFLSAGTSIRRVSALDGTITIFAGSATKAHGGDGLPYTQATFSNVRGLAFSPDLSVLYAIDNGALRVRALNMSGGPTRTIIGTGSTSLLPQDGVPASTASLFDPSSIAVHPTSGLVYISDRYCIRSVDVLNDTTRLVAGNGVTNGAPVDFSSARLGAISPRYQANGVWVGGGLDISPDGSTLAYADTGSNRVRGIDLASGITYSIAGGGTCAANVVQPNNAFFHPSTRTLLVADTGAGTIRQMTVTLDGLPATSPSNVLLGTTARAVVRDNSSFLYVSDNLSIVRRNLNTSTSVTVVGSADRNLINAGLGTDNVPGLLTLVRPAGLRLDPSGRYLYIADTSFHRVLRYEVATGTVTTVAGGGAAMSCGDGGPAADAGAYDVGGITSDAAGNVYFSDGSFTNMVRVVSAATGVVTRLAGSLGTSSSAGGFNFPSYGGDGGPALSAILQRPTLVQMKNGLLYVYDMNNYRLRAINMTTGNITTVVGNGASAYSAAAVQNEVPALLSPVNIRAFQVASDGTIFFAETTGAGYFVRKFNPATGNVSIVFGKVNVLTSDPVDRKLGNDTALGYIVGLALHPITGDLYVATSSPSTVRILYASNSTVNTWGSGVVAEDLTMNDAGDMAFMQLHNPSQSYVLRFLPAGQPPSAAITVASVDTLGTCGYTAENSPARGFFLTKLSMTLHLAANRSIYVATTRRILHFPDPTGNGTVRFLVGRGSFTGCSGSPGTQINLNQPNGVDADADGNVYIADRSNARVWRVGPDGIATTLVGNPSFLPSQSNSAGFAGDDGPASLARVSNPMDVIHDAQTNVLYISDRGNSRIRYVNLTNTPPTIHTLAGTDSIDASVASGLRPTDTALVTLHGLTIDSQRRVLYVVEESGPRVRAIPMAGS